MNVLVRSGLLVTAALIVCSGSGCSQGVKTTDFRLYNQDGVVLKFGSVYVVPDGSGGFRVTITAPTLDPLPLGSGVTNIKYRVTLFDDANGNGLHDPGERIFGQDGSTPPPGGTPPGAGGGPVPPINGPISIGSGGNITAWIEIEYIDEFGNKVVSRIAKKVK